MEVKVIGFIKYRIGGMELYDKLRLETFPIAIKYVKSTRETAFLAAQIPFLGVRPYKKYGNKIALCQAFLHTRRWGTTFAMTSGDNICTTGKFLHRWENIPLEEFFNNQGRQGWHRNIEVEKKRLAAIESLYGGKSHEEVGEYCGFICSPLPKTFVVPDAIFIYCNGSQFTHIVHALSYEYKHVPESSFDGFGEVCFKGCLVPFLTQKPQVVIPGLQERAISCTQDHEIGIGIPGHLLFYILKYLFKTGRGSNVGFPGRALTPILNQYNHTGF